MKVWIMNQTNSTDQDAYFIDPSSPAAPPTAPVVVVTKKSKPIHLLLTVMLNISLSVLRKVTYPNSGQRSRWSHLSRLDSPTTLTWGSAVQKKFTDIYIAGSGEETTVLGDSDRPQASSDKLLEASKRYNTLTFTVNIHFIDHIFEIDFNENLLSS